MMMNLIVFILLSVRAAPVIGHNFSRHGSKNAEEARWLVSKAKWGTLSYKLNGTLGAAVSSFADAEGRIFFYLMGKRNEEAGVSLTLSEASLDADGYGKAACGDSLSMDAEDPRCAKITLSGTIAPCANDDVCAMGREALFTRHPEMANWPVNHHFTVHEMTIQNIWMISNFGGGCTIDVKEYANAEAKHHPAKSLRSRQSQVPTQFALTKNSDFPDWNDKAGRARWVVANSLWTTVSTNSVKQYPGQAWGNIRSVVDGSSLVNAKGLPCFYLPTPDPTAVDVRQDPTIALSFTEASLAERVTSKGTCDGLDANDPLCAQVVLMGKAVPVDVDDDNIKNDMLAAFKARHPLAPWLAKGGAHTGGTYYTIALKSVIILDYYGGYTSVSVDDYLAWTPAVVTQSSM